MRKRRWIIIIILCLVVLAIAALILWLSSSNKGTVSQGTHSQDSDTPLASKQLDGKFMSFSYPGSYSIHQDQAKDNDLELYALTANTIYRKQLAAAVSSLPDGTLQTSSAYLLRRSQPDVYKEVKKTYPYGVVDMWSRLDGTETTAFIVREGKVAVLSFTQLGGDTTKLGTEVDSVLASFQWK